MGEPRVTVAVLGASGYAGGELVRLLLDHPEVRITFLGGKEAAGRTLGDVHPHLAGTALTGETLAAFDDLEAVTAAASFAFCALPHGASAAVAPALVEAGLRVVDLGGDFRLPAEDYPAWYGFEHPAPAWLDKAVYGLSELFGDAVRSAELVANPGCYPTAVALGLVPLLEAGLVAAAPILVDGKTGLSGAGRAANEDTIFTATEESIRPYRVPRHQHTPEMERSLAAATGTDPRVVFVPHLVPTVRGVVTTSYAALVDAATTSEVLTDVLLEAYADAPFVRVLPAGGMVDSKRVRGSNTIELQAVADPRTGQAIVVGAVDNLVKGAAGQAIQNMNLMLGIDETTGLTATGLYP